MRSFLATQTRARDHHATQQVRRRSHRIDDGEILLQNLTARRLQRPVQRVSRLRRLLVRLLLRRAAHSQHFRVLLAKGSVRVREVLPSGQSRLLNQGSCRCRTCCSHSVLYIFFKNALQNRFLLIAVDVVLVAATSRLRVHLVEGQVTGAAGGESWWICHMNRIILSATRRRNSFEVLQTHLLRS